MFVGALLASTAVWAAQAQQTSGRGGVAEPANAGTAAKQPALLTADEVSFDQKRGIMVAAGNVQLSNQGRRVLADRMTYDQNNDRITAEGNVVLIEPGNETFFADRAEITGDLRQGLVERLRGILGEAGKVAAATGARDGDVTTLNQAVYSPCPLCAQDRKSPLWQVRADEVTHDAVSKNVVFRNATFELFGVPVAWTPYFSYPDPSVQRRTGLLPPTAGISTELGVTYEQPFFLDIAPNRDLTVTPLVTTKEGIVLSGEYRFLEEPGETTLGGSVSYSDPAIRSGDGNDRTQVHGHFQGRGRYDLDDRTLAGFDAFWTSQKTYLDRFGFSGEQVLENHAYVEQLRGNDYLGLHGWAFQGLRPDDEQSNIPVVLPFAEAALRSSPLRWDSRVNLDSSLIALTRERGIDTRRVSSELSWEMPWLGNIGDIWRLTIGARGDAYNYDGDPATFEGGGGENNKGRLIPRATLDWSWPLIGSTGDWQHVIQPTAMATTAPESGKDEDIPNEDSQVFEFDETNLWLPSRFPGLDRVDGGTKIAYGLRFDSVEANGIEVSGSFGQSYQFRRNDTVPSDSGVNKNFSDYVGRIDFRPSEYVDVRYRFRIDRSDFDLRRSDLNLGVGPQALRFDIGWLRLSDEPTGLAPRSREEATAGVRWQVMDNLAVAARTRQDLNEHETVSNMVGLVYTHPCLVLIAGLEKSFTTRGGSDDELTFKVRISLINFDGAQGSAPFGANMFGG